MTLQCQKKEKVIQKNEVIEHEKPTLQKQHESKKEPSELKPIVTENVKKHNKEELLEPKKEIAEVKKNTSNLSEYYVTLTFGSNPLRVNNEELRKASLKNVQLKQLQDLQNLSSRLEPVIRGH